MQRQDVDNDNPDMMAKQTKIETDSKIVCAIVRVEGLQFETAEERSKFPRLFKRVIATKMGLDKSYVRVTDVKEMPPSIVEIAFEAKMDMCDEEMVKEIKAYVTHSSSGGLHSDLVSRGVAAVSTYTNEAYLIDSEKPPKWRPEENLSDDEEDVCFSKPGKRPNNPRLQQAKSATKQTPKQFTLKQNPVPRASPRSNAQDAQKSLKEAAAAKAQEVKNKAAAEAAATNAAAEAAASTSRAAVAAQKEAATNNTAAEAALSVSSAAAAAQEAVAESRVAEGELPTPRANILPKIAVARTLPVEKGGKKQLTHLGTLRDVIQQKFKTVLDAFVFFDYMRVDFVSTMNLKRGLIKLEADELLIEFNALVRDFEWKCVDHGKVHCSEFIHLLHWHHIENLDKELGAARLAFGRQTRAEQNKAISIKVPKPSKPTPVCDKLREILKTKYKSVAAFMVVADMDVEHVLAFRELQLAFRKEGINGIDVEELASELSDPSFPATAFKTQSFMKVLRWHSLEDTEAGLKEERLSQFRERNKLEKGLPQIPMAPTSLPFFKERPEVDKTRILMQKHFGNAADAFVYFDTDYSGEITRVKMAHGLQRLQLLDAHVNGEIAVTLDADKLIPELQNLQFTGGTIDAAAFIFNFRWHEKFADAAEAILAARRRKYERAAIIPVQVI